MNQYFKYVLLPLLTVLFGCGGGGNGSGSDAIYGSIAINASTKAGGITARYGSQADANSNAINKCGTGCATVLEYWGIGQCAAVARGTNFAMGWSNGNTQSQADSNAVAKCNSAGGLSCTIELSMCN